MPSFEDNITFFLPRHSPPLTLVFSFLWFFTQSEKYQTVSKCLEFWYSTGVDLEKLSLNFSSSSFVILVTLTILTQTCSCFVYCYVLFLINSYFQVFFSLEVILYVVKNVSKYCD